MRAWSLTHFEASCLPCVLVPCALHLLAKSLIKTFILLFGPICEEQQKHWLLAPKQDWQKVCPQSAVTGSSRTPLHKGQTNSSFCLSRTSYTILPSCPNRLEGFLLVLRNGLLAFTMSWPYQVDNWGHLRFTLRTRMSLIIARAVGGGDRWRLRN